MCDYDDDNTKHPNRDRSGDVRSNHETIQAIRDSVDVGQRITVECGIPVFVGNPPAAGK